MSAATLIFNKAFKKPRDPRSPEYQNGALCALRYRLGEIGKIHCPHPIGTAQADAWFAGVDEGHAIARHHGA